MSTYKILISDPVADVCSSHLTARGFEVEYRPGIAPAKLLELIPGYDGLIVRSATKVTDRVIQVAQNLKVIGRAGVGIDNIDVASATRNGVVVVNAAAANTISAVEHTFALMLALAREIPRAHRSLQEGEWNRSAFKGVELFEKTLGIIGLGKIGRELAARARAFGMKILAYDPLIEPEIFKSAGVEERDLNGLVRQSDFITLHVPLSAETKSLLRGEHFAMAKRNLRIVNAARGGVVDEKALYHALINGQIAGAALDVFEKEPPDDNPLLGLDNVVATPHLGAGTFEAQQRVAEEIAELVGGFLVDRKVENIVNPEAFIREI